MGSIEHDYQAALRTVSCNGLSAESGESEDQPDTHGGRREERSAETQNSTTLYVVT